jgi:hypothetical protein
MEWADATLAALPSGLRRRLPSALCCHVLGERQHASDGRQSTHDGPHLLRMRPAGNRVNGAATEATQHPAELRLSVAVSHPLSSGVKSAELTV